MEDLSGITCNTEQNSHAVYEDCFSNAFFKVHMQLLEI